MSQCYEQSLKSSDDKHAFLATYIAPLRVSVVAENGFPVICSLWFEYANGLIWCATQKSARIVELLYSNPKCAFELAPNEPPYFGVRGQALASVHKDDADKLLERLLDRYIGRRDTRLAKMLLNRTADEVAIRIDPQQLYAWDYRNRMQT